MLRADYPTHLEGTVRRPADYHTLSIHNLFFLFLSFYVGKYMGSMLQPKINNAPLATILAFGHIGNTHFTLRTILNVHVQYYLEYHCHIVQTNAQITAFFFPGNLDKLNA